MPRRLPAVCCNVDVVNGGTGRRRYGFVSIDATVNVANSNACAIAEACTSSNCTTWSFAPAAVSLPSAPKSLEPAKRRPPSDTIRESNATLLPSASGASNVAVTSQYEARTNAIRSRSRSTIKRVATDCTRPAERPGPTLRHSTGESS